MAKSAKLTKALAEGNVVIQKIISGEVRVSFRNPSVNDININHNKPESLTANVSVQDCRNSNLDNLIIKGHISIV